MKPGIPNGIVAKLCPDPSKSTGPRLQIPPGTTSEELELLITGPDPFGSPCHFLHTALQAKGPHAKIEKLEEKRATAGWLSRLQLSFLPRSIFQDEGESQSGHEFTPLANVLQKLINHDFKMNENPGSIRLQVREILDENQILRGYGRLHRE